MSRAIGIYTGEKEVVAVSVGFSIKGPAITNYAIEPLPKKELQAGGSNKNNKKTSTEVSAIKKALHKIGASGSYVTAAFSSSHLATRHFVMQDIPNKNKDEAIRYEASRHFPFKLSESVLDYCVDDSCQNVLVITASMARQRVIWAHLLLLRRGSAKVHMIEPVFSAMGRAVASLGGFDKKAPLGFIFIGAGGNVNVTLISKGKVQLSRDFLLSGSEEEDKERFHDELKVSFDYFQKNTGGESIKQVFIAGGKDLGFWTEYLSSVFDGQISFDVAAIPSARPISPEVMGSLLVPYGLALRYLNHKSPLGDICLLPEGERISKPGKFFSILGIELLTAVLLFGSIYAFGIAPYIGNLTYKRNLVLEKADPADAALAKNKFTKLKQMKADITTQIKDVKEFLEGNVPIRDILKSLGETRPKSIWLQQIDHKNLQIADKKSRSGETDSAKAELSFTGICFLGDTNRESKIVNRWVSKFSRDKIFKDNFKEINIKSLKKKKIFGRDTTFFEITCR